ncbi:hypothetical protein [Pseudoalteromonas luteoviolacea]|uniref:hypothetical protein n=1 Tax=Pseudoalteromonas luteoviolacea TaxID=43657 RepID=UPI00115302EB|nr:hypothetical protein [Pseudoalteromonas luteoviolacea]TQF67596.1 hypothetical protein FLM44_20655 [Pseudoalteromonas luteoviolacea]
MKVNANPSALGTAPADNTQVKLAKSGSETALSNTLSTLEPDVYHGSSGNEEPATYERPFNIGESVKQIETVEETMDRIFEASSELYLEGAMYNAAESMTAEYDNFMSDLSKSNPDLAAKDWGFSVDANGEIAVSGQLSDEEAELLTAKLNSNEDLVRYANEIKDNFLKFTALERGPEGQGTSKYWGKYDVTNENFGDIINMRELVEQGRYRDSGNVITGNQLNSYNFVENMGEQLKSNAQVTYAA